GVVTAFRKSALVDAGLFSPDMATEDIDMTWKLQKKHYDIRYEPAALVWMHVPRTLPVLWKQRRRWALGLAQVLRRHTGEVMGWKHRRMWPILAESMLSILWAYVFVGFTVIWIGSYAAGVPPVGASPFPNWWGMTIATLSLLQLAVGMSLDRRYDRTVARYFAVAVYYPLLYWLLMAVVTTVTTPLGFTRGARGPQRWQTPREEAQAMSPEVDSPELAELQTTRLPGA
ncbi:MAG: glycosyltransferase, partial [Actinomycetota bacterium]|nr:glycosyltransferase [Actinomycetota bacterium]